MFAAAGSGILGPAPVLHGHHASTDIKMDKWLLCALLFLATTLNYLDRQTLSILAPAIQRELGVDNAGLGLLFSVFYYSYTFAQFAVGRVLDRVNLRWAYGFAVLAWSAAASLTAFSNGFLALLVFRFLLGVAESPNWPAAMRIVARALPAHQRSLGNGIFTSGTSVGALIAPALILAVSAWLGWRAAFAAVGSLGMVWFALWWRWTSRPVYGAIWQPSPSAPGTPAYAPILGSPQFWRVLAVACLVNPCLYFNLNWLPVYFSQQHHVAQDSRMAGLLTLIYVGLDLGYLACGAGVIALTGRGMAVPRARRVVMAVATGLLMLSLLAPGTKGIGEAVWLLAAVNFGAGMWIAMYLTLAQEVSAAHVSTAAGLLGGSGSLAGAVAMWGVGQVTTATGSFTGPFLAVGAAAVLAAAAGWTATRTASPNH